MVDQCKMAIGGLREQWKLLSFPPRIDSSLSGVNQRAGKTWLSLFLLHDIRTFIVVAFDTFFLLIPETHTSIDRQY